MPIQITMPRLSDTMEEGTLLKWHVKAGDKVSSGDQLADVETDKATMELPAFDDGTVAKLAIEEGQTVAVGDLILILAQDGESVEDAAKAAPGSAPEAAPGSGEGGEEKQKAAKSPTPVPERSEGPDAAEEDEEQADTSGAISGGGGPVKISPLARKMAEEKGLDLGSIQGSGPGGRIIKRDILAAAEGKGQETSKATSGGGASGRPAPLPGVGGRTLEAKTISVSSMRKTIAKRLLESKTTIPHFTVSMAIDMDPLMKLRATLNSQLQNQGVKLSVGDFITRASALACVEHPTVNSSWTDSGIEQHGTVNVGIAVALDEARGGGLVVPVLRDVQNMGLRTISEQTKALAGKARGTGLSAEEMQGGTFTLSNLGMFGVEHFEAIINPPQAAILALGAALERPVVRDGQIVVGHEMTATLSADHRVIDGAIGAAYLQSFKQLLENPAALLV